MRRERELQRSGRKDTPKKRLRYGVAILAIAMAWPVTTWPVMAATLSSFAPSHVQGGGGLTVVTSDPDDPMLLVSGGDNSGIHVSVDGGVTWRARNFGFDAPGELSIAAITFAPDALNPRVFVAVGAGEVPSGPRDEDSGVYTVSDITDFAEPWQPLLDAATTPSLPEIAFSGEHNGGELSGPLGLVYANREPRSTGRLLAYQADCIDGAGWCLFAGTFDQGIHVWWSDQPIPDRPLEHGPVPAADYDYKPLVFYLDGSVSSSIRSLAFDATNEQLWAASFYAGLYRIPLSTDTDVRLHPSDSISLECTAEFSHSVEELALYGDTLYVAAGPHGVFEISPLGGGGTCTQIKEQGCVSGCEGPFWRSIAVGPVGANDEVIIGSVHPANLNGDPEVVPTGNGSDACPPYVPNTPFDTALRLRADSSWDSLLTPATTNPCDPTVFGTSPPETWWRADLLSFLELDRRATATQPGRNSFNAHYLHLAADEVLWAAGSSGIHRVEMIGGIGEWVPAVTGLQATQGTMIHNDSAADVTWYGMRDYFGVRWDGTPTRVDQWVIPEGSSDGLDEMTGITRSLEDPDDVYFGALDTNVGTGAADPYVIRCDESTGLLDCDPPLAIGDTLCADGDWQVASLASYFVDAGTINEREVLLAAVIPQKNLNSEDCEGIYKWDAAWSKVDSTVGILTRTTKDFYSVSMAVESTTDPTYAYLYNRETGLHRVDIDNDTVTGLPITGDGTSPWHAMDKFSGYMTSDLVNGRIYVSRDDQACVYNLASDSGGCVTSQGLGPIALTDDPSRLVGMVSASNAAAAKPCLFLDVDTNSPSRHCVAGDLNYQNAVLFPTDVMAKTIDSSTVEFTVTSLTGGFYTGRLTAP